RHRETRRAAEKVSLAALPAERLSPSTGEALRHRRTQHRMWGEPNAQSRAHEPQVQLAILDDGALIPWEARRDLAAQADAVAVKARGEAEAVVGERPDLASEMECEIAKPRERGIGRLDEVDRLNDVGAEGELRPELGEESRRGRRVGVEDRDRLDGRVLAEDLRRQPVERGCLARMGAVVANMDADPARKPDRRGRVVA